MLFTVFSPVYNSAATLHRVYDSLCKQTLTDFEWVIIDDGSTDDTALLVRNWQGQSWFPIRYIFQENQGKYVAFNHAVSKALGKFFIPLDGDDGCVPQALEKMLQYWQEIPSQDQENFSGICVLCCDQQGGDIGKPFPFSPWDTTSAELYYSHKNQGEKWGFHRTDILKKFPFPSLENTKFIPEGYVWRRIAKHYKIRCVNEILRIYYVDERPDNLSRTLYQPKNLKGRHHYYQWVLNHEGAWFIKAPLLFSKQVVQYSRLSALLGIPLKAQWHGLDTYLVRWLWLLSLGVGYSLAWWDRKKQ